MKKIAESAYLLQVKPALKSLVAQLCEKYEFASVLATDCGGRIYSVSKSGINISDSDVLCERGFCVRVFNGSYFEFSFTDISEAKIPAVIAKIDEMAATSAPLSPTKYIAPADEPMTLESCSECEKDPAEFSDEEIIARLRDITERGYALSDAILACNANYNRQFIHKMFISKNKDMQQNLLWSCGHITAVARRGEEAQNSFKGFSGQCGAELLDQMKDGVQTVVQNTLELLDSTPIVPGEYDCVCTPEVTGMIVHEAFGHGVEMDMFVKDRALAKDFIGKRVASDIVTMHDGAAAAREVASYAFDDEGTPATDTVIIKNGILERGISDLQSATFLGTPPTANGRRQGFDRKAYTRMTNTFFESGHDTVEEMIQSIQFGYLLDNPSSGMEDPKNWGIQCMVGVAREIKDGKLTGKVHSPIVLTGYVPTLLKSISMMSENVALGGSGFCGKGYKEWVKVSDGGPYIKAKIRLG